MAVRIICINKSGGYHENPHEAVSSYGWKNENTGESGKNDRPSMVQWVKDEGIAYVVDLQGNKAYCFVNKSRNGTEFLQTQSDSRPTNNLLELQECGLWRGEPSEEKPVRSTADSIYNNEE